jgi:hypothetical protein
MIDTGEVTAVFRVPYYPISFGLAFSCLVQCFVLSLRVQELIGGEDE